MNKDRTYITIKWFVDDVQDIRNDLNEQQCMEVLNMAKKEHDATIGINYEVLEHWANFLFPKNEEDYKLKKLSEGKENKQ
mgnify:CR=1 FL=1